MFMYPGIFTRESNLLNELERIHEEMDSVFGLFNQASNIGMDVWDNNNELIVRLELPGVDPAEIHTTIDANQLIIEAEIKDTAPNKDEGRYLRRERKTGKFSKQLRLPYDVETEKVTAEYKYGVLTIKLPKAEASKPKIIKVKSA